MTDPTGNAGRGRLAEVLATHSVDAPLREAVPLKAGRDNWIGARKPA
jgi:hypothetical protein